MNHDSAPWFINSGLVFYDSQMSSDRPVGADIENGHLARSLTRYLAGCLAAPGDIQCVRSFAIRAGLLSCAQATIF